MPSIIPPRLTLMLIVAIVIYYVIILSLLKHKKLNMKYTLLWLLTGLIMLPEIARKSLLKKAEMSCVDSDYRS